MTQSPRARELADELAGAPRAVPPGGREAAPPSRPPPSAACGSKRITLEQLEALGACRDALAWFPTRYRKGATIEQALAAAEAEERWTWLGWWAAHAPGLTLAERDGLCERAGDARFWRGLVAFYAPGLTLAERNEFCDRSDAPDYWREMVGALDNRGGR